MSTPPVPKKRATRRRAGGQSPESVPPVPPVTDTPADPFTDTAKPPEDAPPKAKGGTGGTGASGSRRAGRKPALQEALEDLLAVPTMAYSFVGDEWAAALITTRGERLAEDWYNLAQKNPAVKRVLTRVVEGSAWGGVIGSSAAILLPLAQHHGLIPGADPFSAFYPPLPDPGGQTTPIVPPPPMPPSPSSPAGARAGGTAPGPGRTDVIAGAVIVGPPPSNGGGRS